MGRFNSIQFLKETKKSINSLSNIARNAALARFNVLKNDLLTEFDNNEITKEIEVGPTADNSSGTLKGRGNLFSFIGFPEDQKPIDVVRQALKDLIQMDNRAEIEDTPNAVIFKFKVRIPTLELLYSMTPLPWENGRSWLRGIERGLSGFGHYMYWKTLPFPPSRSSTGIQVDNILRAGSFSTRPYISKILNGFKTKIN